MARQLRAQLEQEAQYDPLRDPPSEARTIHTPPPTSAPEAPPPGRPDEPRDT